jgi:hypothetical protein
MIEQNLVASAPESTNSAENARSPRSTGELLERMLDATIRRQLLQRPHAAAQALTKSKPK